METSFAKRLVVTLAALAVVLARPAWLGHSASSPSVTFVDVGQGDASIVRDSTGFEVLIDGGRPSAGPTVVAYLHEHGIDDIDVLLATHADSDHIGGLLDVLQAPDISVQQVLYNGYPGTTTTWYAFATAVAQEGLQMTPAQFPETYCWGTYTAHVLNPPGGLVNPDQNDASVVVHLDGPNSDCLFTGDIDASVEADVLARGVSVAADILKVAHHGSKYSSSEAFLAAVHPAVAVISVGPNSYGHPAAETLARLLAIGAEIRRTDQLGTIVMYLGGDYVIHLPVIQRSGPTPTPTSTSPAPTRTATLTQPAATATATGTPTAICDPCYPTVCIPPPPPDLDCNEIPYRDFTVLCDPHGFDGDNDGIGCAS